jgi:RNA recognition motif-containing protein
MYASDSATFVQVFVSELIQLFLAGQNRGKAALEYSDAASAEKAFSHMNGGQLDGATLKVELSNLPIRPQRVSRSPPPRTRNGRGGNGRGRGDRTPLFTFALSVALSLTYAFLVSFSITVSLPAI